ncbi:MAG: response regulator transcription factor [Desulfosalsimonas sp.]
MPDYLRLLLSEREYFVLKRALLGSTYRQIARELDISESTVKTYMRRIYEKTGAKGKKQLVETLNRF